MEKQRLLKAAQRGLILVLALCGTVGSALGYTEVSMAHVADPESGISMECQAPLRSTPAGGYYPLTFRIKNRSNETHSWRVTFTAGGGAGRTGMRYTADLAVEGGQTRSWNLLVPRAELNSRDGGYLSFYGNVEGYGVVDGGRFHVPIQSPSGLDRSNFTMMSESLANAVWSKVEAEAKTVAVPSADHPSLFYARTGGSRTLHGSPVNLDELPPDWRAFAGAGNLWLSSADWESLSSDRRSAVRQWVAAGGHLFVASPTDTLERLPLLPASLAAGKRHPLGFGWVKAVKLANDELEPKDTAQEIAGLHSAVLPAWQEDYHNRWAFFDFVGRPKLNVPLVLMFVGVFATVIGPLNLLWFAPPKRRARLFFTIPLLSAGASVALFAVIAAGDGVGGMGARNVLLYMPAGENHVTVLQEQIARSRLLFRRSFKVPETVQVNFASQQRQSDRGLQLERKGEVMSGDWFRSRSVQAHVLRASVPSRAAVSLEQGGIEGDPPVLLSSVAAPLRELHYIDAAGQYWRAGKVETGRPVTLVPSTREALEEQLGVIAREFSLNFQAMVDEIRHRPGHFYAVADPMPEGPIETLSSIRWQKQNILCFGTCAGAEGK